MTAKIAHHLDACFGLFQVLFSALIGLFSRLLFQRAMVNSAVSAKVLPHQGT